MNHRSCCGCERDDDGLSDVCHDHMSDCGSDGDGDGCESDCESDCGNDHSAMNGFSSV